MNIRRATQDDVPEIVRLKALLMIDGWPFDIELDDAWRERCAGVARQLLASDGLPVRALGLAAEDPKAAEALRTESGRNIRRSVLVRSLTDLVAGIDELANLTGRVRQTSR